MIDWDEFLAFVEQRLALDAAYCAEHGLPERLAREVDAKRNIVNMCKGAAGSAFPDFDGGYASGLEDAVMAMAQVYSGKPGWKREWSA